jgi:lipid-binding SYLF domain-containing protein
MKTKQYLGKKALLGKIVVFAWMFGILLGVGSHLPTAEASTTSRNLVEASRIAFDNFLNNPESVEFRHYLKQAKGVLIIPQSIKGALFWGAQGGSGVLFVRDNYGGGWSGPAFYTLGGVSIGFQFGGSVSEIVLLIMSDRGVSSLMASSMKLGANASVAVGPVGGGISAETANLSADIISYARSKGLFGGVALDGAVVAVRSGWNHEYYGKPVNSADILIVKSVSNPHANELIQLITHAAAK